MKNNDNRNREMDLAICPHNPLPRSKPHSTMSSSLPVSALALLGTNPLGLNSLKALSLEVDGVEINRKMRCERP